jgi:hypothetical protein
MKADKRFLVYPPSICISGWLAKGLACGLLKEYEKAGLS